MYTPAQQAAIAIVATVPTTVRFGVLPISCEGLDIGFVDAEYVDELTAAAKASPARPALQFGPAIRGGAQMGLLPTISHVVEQDEDHILVTRDGRTVTVEVSLPGEFMALTDMYGTDMRFDIGMADAIIAAMQTLKARAGD